MQRWFDPSPQFLFFMLNRKLVFVRDWGSSTYDVRYILEFFGLLHGYMEEDLMEIDLKSIFRAISPVWKTG